MNKHVTVLIEDFPALESCAEDIAGAFEMLAGCFRSGGKLLLAGNGGSAADCEHWSGELLKSFRSSRRIDGAEAEQLGPELAGKPSGRPARRTAALAGFFFHGLG